MDDGRRPAGAGEPALRRIAGASSACHAVVLLALALPFLDLPSCDGARRDVYTGYEAIAMTASVAAETAADIASGVASARADGTAPGTGLVAETSWRTAALFLAGVVPFTLVAFASAAGAAFAAAGALGRRPARARRLAGAAGLFVALALAVHLLAARALLEIGLRPRAGWFAALAASLLASALVAAGPLVTRPKPSPEREPLP